MKLMQWKIWVKGVVMLAGMVLAASVFAAQDQVEHPNCLYCGMDRTKFAHSRVYLKYDDGSSTGTCSLHCAAIDMALKIDKTPVAIQVGDYDTKELIDAEKAIWVIGGRKMGVMTRRAKWAFGSPDSAEAFVKQSGGEIADYNQAVKASFENMYEDMKMIREKRRMMRMKQGS